MTYRSASWVLLLLVGCLASAPPASAHGGAFAPPPPESGPGGAPGRPTGDPPTHVDPGIGGPIVTPGGKPGLRPDRPFKRGRTDETPTFEHSWELWWDINRHALLPRPHNLRPQTVTPEGASTTTSWEAERARLAHDEVLPFLRRLLDAGTRQDADVRGSACIALGKLSDDPNDVDLLLGWLEAEGAKPIVRESAALALGLLRRTDPAQQLGVNQLDPLRGRLLMVWDARVDGKKVRVPERTRVFTMYALGLLGDQPFDARTAAKDGALFSGVLWERVGLPYSERELRVAPLVALGLQPAAGLPEGVRAGLRGLVAREKTRGRAWDAYERSRALTAVARLGGPGSRKQLLRLLADSRQHAAVSLSAVLAVGAMAADWTSIERTLAVRSLVKSLEQKHAGVLLTGLRLITLGRLLAADLESGHGRLLASTPIRTELESRASRGLWWARGYGLIALGIAARHAHRAGAAGKSFAERADTILIDALQTKSLHASARGAAAVGLGLRGNREHGAALARIVDGHKLDGELRGHAALALGQLRASDAAALRVLGEALGQRKNERLRGRAALALSLLGSDDATKRLLDELKSSRSQAHLASVTVALGNLGDLGAVTPLIEIARTTKSDLVRAMAAVALGRLLDPEPQPSLLKILIPANYPARSAALHDALTIL